MLDSQTKASQYPQHTAQEWRNYFKEYVAPRKRSEKAFKKISPPPLQRPTSSRSSKIPSSPLIRSWATSGPSSSQNAPRTAWVIQDSQDSLGQMTESTIKKRRGSDPTLTDEQLFRRDLLDLAQDLNLEVDFTPEICGRKIPLFKLWQVVRSDDFGGIDRVNGMSLWPKVARFLSFKDAQQSSAADDLKSCYEEILTDLEAYQQYKLDQSFTESQENEMLEAQLRETAARETQNLYEAEDEEEEELAEEEELVEEEELAEEEELIEDDEDDDLDGPQYSPHPLIPSSSSKRSFGADRTNVDNSYNKRQRIDKGKGKELEIPSTPEDVIKNTQMPQPSFKPSPLKYTSPAHKQQEQEEEEDSSEIEDLWAKPLKLKPKQKLQPQNLEPETQDFNYPQTQAQPEAEEDDPFVDISSSPPPRHLPDRSSGSNAANRGSDSNPPGSSTQSHTESEKHAALEQYIHECISFGYAQEAVVFALDTTTMEIGQHAMQVMEALEMGKEIPDDIPGVWTEEDDRVVEGSVDTEGFKSCVRKHGVNRCEVRRKFLRDRREVREMEEENGG